MNRSEIIGFLREQRYLPHPADAGLDRDLMEAIKCLRTMVPARSSKCLHENDKEHLDDTNVADIPLGKNRVIIDPIARDHNRTVFDSPTVRDTLLASMRDTKCKTELKGYGPNIGLPPTNIRQIIDEEGRVDVDFDVPRKVNPDTDLCEESLGRALVELAALQKTTGCKVMNRQATKLMAHGKEDLNRAVNLVTRVGRRKNKKGRDLSTRP